METFFNRSFACLLIWMTWTVAAYPFGSWIVFAFFKKRGQIVASEFALGATKITASVAVGCFFFCLGWLAWKWHFSMSLAFLMPVLGGVEPGFFELKKGRKPEKKDKTKVPEWMAVSLLVGNLPLMIISATLLCPSPNEVERLQRYVRHHSAEWFGVGVIIMISLWIIDVISDWISSLRKRRSAARKVIPIQPDNSPNTQSRFYDY